MRWPAMATSSGRTFASRSAVGRLIGSGRAAGEGVGKASEVVGLAAAGGLTTGSRGGGTGEGGASTGAPSRAWATTPSGTLAIPTLTAARSTRLLHPPQPAVD